MSSVSSSVTFSLHVIFLEFSYVGGIIYLDHNLFRSNHKFSITTFRQYYISLIFKCDIAYVKKLTQFYLETVESQSFLKWDNYRYLHKAVIFGNRVNINVYTQ